MQQTLMLIIVSTEISDTRRVRVQMHRHQTMTGGFSGNVVNPVGKRFACRQPTSTAMFVVAVVQGEDVFHNVSQPRVALAWTGKREGKRLAARLSKQHLLDVLPTLMGKNQLPRLHG
jgi:hypothetical protein